MSCGIWYQDVSTSLRPAGAKWGSNSGMLDSVGKFRSEPEAYLPPQAVLNDLCFVRGLVLLLKETTVIWTHSCYDVVFRVEVDKL